MWSALATPLDRYIATAAFRAFILVAGALTALFSLLEFVEQLASVGEGRYSLLDAFIYVLLTAPSRVLQVTPVSMLIGCLLALGAFGRNSELTALRSVGISESRIIGSVLKLAVPIILVLFLIAEFVVPPAQELAQTQRAAALSTSTTDRDYSSFWAQGEHQYLNVQRFRGSEGAEDIDIYAFADDGSLTSFVHADQADIHPDGTWLLVGVLRKTIDGSDFQTERLASLPWRSFVSSAQIQLLTLPPEAMPPVALFRYVRDLARNHQQGLRYEQELWRKISIPLSMIAMIMASAPFVFAPPRGQSIGQQITIGAIVGIVFSLFQQIAGHLDLLLDLNPAAAALVPSLLLMGLSVYLFRRAHR
ncbi:LPS export ABC transporter permease LptG [Aliidongia dinghuensis]|uniref:LPS export ABC transporter permease LptG n=1 Tax=Aliidongia dinghuensis TaxID=1867774 RepID=A0A8J3E6S4_9PROT|nr:LPS export ABC transporter permease LptG [Aliidongia dinghuensis]